MASAAIPASAVCEGGCEHTDCNMTRRLLEQACSECGEPIGFDRRFFQDNDWTLLTHAACIPDPPTVDLAELLP